MAGAIATATEEKPREAWKKEQAFTVAVIADFHVQQNGICGPKGFCQRTLMNGQLVLDSVPAGNLRVALVKITSGDEAGNLHFVAYPGKTDAYLFKAPGLRALANALEQAVAKGRIGKVSEVAVRRGTEIKKWEDLGSFLESGCDAEIVVEERDVFDKAERRMVRKPVQTMKWAGNVWDGGRRGNWRKNPAALVN